jgi:Uma2 family endonuclease
MSVLPARHQVSADEFERMIAAGVFADDDRLELIGGEILEMSPIDPGHQGCVNRLTHLFARLAIDERVIVQPQGPFRADDWSRPQPDLALLRWRDDFYARAVARPADMLLAIEVADSSLRFDRTIKRPRDAQAGVPEMWIIDLRGEVVEVARRPSAEGYGSVERLARGDTIAPEAFPELTCAVDDLLA